MTHELRLFFVALQFLTRVPVPAWVGFEPAWLQACLRHFPLVGACVGAWAAAVLWVALQFWPPVVAAMLSLLATVWITGAYHEDGLADTCDALGGSVSRDRALQIMKDSRIGSYGAVARVLALGLKVALVAWRNHLPRHVLTSPLLRCADVGRWLRRWGWRHEIVEGLMELDFGAWDGRPWRHIAPPDIDLWCADFLHQRPGGGENLQRFFERVAAWSAPSVGCVIGHAGWMLARQWLASGRAAPVRAADWPAAPRYGACWRL